MSRIPDEIKAKSADHLKKLIAENRLKKGEFAQSIGRSAQTVSAMVKGSGPVTERTARAINALYPDYSVEWLMGLAEYPNALAESIAAIDQSKRDATLLREGFRTLATLMGYTITKSAEATINDGRVRAEEKVREVNEGYLVSRNGKQARISLVDMHLLQNEIADFVDFKLDRLLQGRKSGADLKKLVINIKQSSPDIQG